jgi:localization factor PodJL
LLEEKSMTLRTLLAALAASALLVLPHPHALADSDPQHNAPYASPPGTAAQPTVIELLAAAAQAGSPEAMNLLGVAYAAGAQVPRDYPMALYWLQKAIDGGSTDAMSNLATMYLRGLGLPHDPANALRWYARAAAGGNVVSMYTVAVMADEGLGVSRDPRLAQAMYRRAAESGFAPAMMKISDRCAHAGARRNLVEAYAWLQLASQSGVPEPLQIEVLAKLERLEARLGVDGREQARLRVLKLTEIAKSRMRASEPGDADLVHWTRPSFRTVVRSSPNADQIAMFR